MQKINKNSNANRKTKSIDESIVRQQRNKNLLDPIRAETFYENTNPCNGHHATRTFLSSNTDVNRTLVIIFKCNAGELHTHFRTRNDSIPNVMFYATILVNIDVTSYEFRLFARITERNRTFAHVMYASKCTSICLTFPQILISISVTFITFKRNVYATFLDQNFY
jgi:hypothetical protein